MKFRIKLILYAILYFPTTEIKGQDWNRVWCFGDSAGIDFSNLSMPAPISSLMDSPYSCSSVGDSSGLLMYSFTPYIPLYVQGYNRTVVIQNKYHGVMLHGDSLIGRAGYNGLTFVNKPGSDSIFYLFQWEYGNNAGLYYSIVEPHYNNDTGRVLIKNVKLPITNDSLEYGISTVKHANGRDWWIIVRNGTSMNRFVSFLVTPDTIFGPMEQNIGTVTTTITTTATVSKTGNKIAVVSRTGTVEVYNFDRCSGTINNPIPINVIPQLALFGCEFSPNENFLYIGNTNNLGGTLELLQINLADSNPSNTIQTIYSAAVPASGGNFRIGPDNKIYFTCLYDFGWRYPDSCRNQYNENLGVINFPDSIGAACNFQPFSFQLGGKRTYWSLPNNPNYSLGPITGSTCDSLTNEIKNAFCKNEFKIFPNPTNETLNISGYFPIGSTFRIFNSIGELVLARKVFNYFDSINTSNIANGIYFIDINNSSKCKLIVQH